MQSNPSLLDEVYNRLMALPPEAQKKAIKETMEATGGYPFVPSPGPQTLAYFSEADDLYYGGQAGGGKSALGLGLAMNEHSQSLVLRRINKYAFELFDMFEKIKGDSDGRNAGHHFFKYDGKKVSFGGCQYEKDKENYKGIAHDLIFFDEIPDFLFSQFAFIKGWNRSDKPGQRCRVICAGNPPTQPEGLWVIDYWGAWLDPKHPNPAKDGELRWYIMDDNDVSHQVDGKGRYSYNHDTGEILLVSEDANPKDYPPHVELIRSRSRTFIRARLEDNPYLRDTDYAATLDNLPAEIRSAYRDGRFDLSLKDNPWQVIPTSWITAAIARWEANPNPPKGVPMCAISADVAAGGEDDTTIARRYDGWYEKNLTVPGKQTPMGRDVAALMIANRKDNADLIVDFGGGYGGGVGQVFKDNNMEYYAYKGSEKSHARTKDGKLGFANKRAETYWRFREALDPDQEGGSPIMLPPGNNKLIAGLAAPKFEIRGTEIHITIKDNARDGGVTVKKLLGYSPDDADAVVMAWWKGPKMDSHYKEWKNNYRPGGGRPHPKPVLGHAARKAHRLRRPN